MDSWSDGSVSWSDGKPTAAGQPAALEMADRPPRRQGASCFVVAQFMYAALSALFYKGQSHNPRGSIVSYTQRSVYFKFYSKCRLSFRDKSARKYSTLEYMEYAI